MRLTTQIGEYDMDQVILDLGSGANVLPKQTWELMGKPKLQWSNIQQKMENQQKIIPLGRLSGIIIGTDGVCTTTIFEMIQILDDSNPYPTLLGLNWEIDSMAIINLKKRKIIFESDNMRVIVPLARSKGVRYTEPVREEYSVNDINNIYQITTKLE